MIYSNIYRLFILIQTKQRKRILYSSYFLSRNIKYIILNDQLSKDQELKKLILLFRLFLLRSVIINLKINSFIKLNWKRIELNLYFNFYKINHFFLLDAISKI